MLPEADVEPREKEGGRLRRMGNGKIEMRKRENNSFLLFLQGRGAGRKSGSSLVAERLRVVTHDRMLDDRLCPPIDLTFV
jgi:hypothetical protein